eukprot:8788299-Alexandrium_andersonii.AAC.1
MCIRDSLSEGLGARGRRSTLAVSAVLLHRERERELRLAKGEILPPALICSMAVEAVRWLGQWTIQ